jgi:hypothetical protein
MATVAKALLIVDAVESGFWLVAIAVVAGICGGVVVPQPAAAKERQHNSMAAWFVIFLTSREKYSTINNPVFCTPASALTVAVTKELPCLGLLGFAALRAGEVSWV